jgi:hypothetical protein
MTVITGAIAVEGAEEPVASPGSLTPVVIPSPETKNLAKAFDEMIREMVKSRANMGNSPDPDFSDAGFLRGKYFNANDDCIEVVLSKDDSKKMMILHKNLGSLYKQFYNYIYIPNIVYNNYIQYMAVVYKKGYITDDINFSGSFDGKKMNLSFNIQSFDDSTIRFAYGSLDEYGDPQYQSYDVNERREDILDVLDTRADVVANYKFVNIVSYSFKDTDEVESNVYIELGANSFLPAGKYYIQYE